MNVNVIVEPMEESQLPPGLECQYSYSEIQAGSSKIAVSIKNHSQKVLKIPKGVKLAKYSQPIKFPRSLIMPLKLPSWKKTLKTVLQSQALQTQ